MSEDVFQKVEVLEKNGTRSVLDISSYESMVDGYTYFYTSYGSKRCLTNDITMIRVLGIRYNPVAEIIGKVVGGTTVWYVKKIFLKYAEDACPSSNPAIKWCWKTTAKLGTLGVGLAADRLTVHAVQEAVQPLTDLFKLGIDIGKDMAARFNHAVHDDEPQMKEVFEEGSTN